MAFGIRLVALVGSATVQDDVGGNSWLHSYDPQAHDGRGAATWTPDPSAAMTFATVGDAFDCWRAVPANRPLREDGEPNRPLTAAAITVEPLP